jgi:hypothetical protein
MAIRRIGCAPHWGQRHHAENTVRQRTARIGRYRMTVLASASIFPDSIAVRSTESLLRSATAL